MSGEGTGSRPPSPRLQAFGRTWRCVWEEDECLRKDPDAECWPAAWKRLFGEDPPNKRAATKPQDHEDFGDAGALRVGDRLILHSYDGHSLWVPA